MADNNSSVLKQQYPWLFLDESLFVDIIYDLYEPEEDDDPREVSAVEDTIKTAKQLQTALQQMGHSANLTAVGHQNYQKIIPKLSGNVVFNQVEEDELGVKVLSLLEKLNKPVTGADSVGFALSWDKSKIKDVFISAEVPTPRYLNIGLNDQIGTNNLSYPLFVKAADDHGSLSINENSVVQNPDQLKAQVEWIRENIGGAALIEEYIDGRELQITVLGNAEQLILLPTKEIIFGEEFSNKPKVVTYKAKWETKSSEYTGTSNMSCPAELSISQKKALEVATKAACQALRVRDYARFDVRLKDNTPYFIDYNANPAIGPNDASALPAKIFGLSYEEFIASIIAVTLDRSH